MCKLIKSRRLGVSRCMLHFSDYYICSLKLQRSNRMKSGVYKHGKTRSPPKDSFEDYPLVQAIFTYISYGVLIIVGHTADFLRKIGLKKRVGSKNVI